MPEQHFPLPAVPPRGAQNLHLGVLVTLYLCGATHLRDLMQSLGLTAFKIGLTARRYVDGRVLDLRGRRYAGVLADENHRETTLKTYNHSDEWFLSPIPNPAADPVTAALLGQLPHGTFDCDRGVVSFRMPHSMDVANLEQRFQELLVARNLLTVLATKDGRARLRDAGLPERARLFTDYALIGRRRRSISSELFCVRPTRELDVLLHALLLAIEQEQARHTMPHLASA